MFFLLTLMACGSSPPPEPAPAPAEVAPAAAAPAVDSAADEELLRRMDALEERIDEVELELGQVQLMVVEMEKSVNQAADVKYNPSATTLDARDVQSALDRLAQKVEGIQGSQQKMGRPSDELFRIPKDNEPPPKGNQPPPNGNQPPRR